MHSTARRILRLFGCGLALAALVALPPGASDAKKSSNTFYVANNGIDSPSCGAADDPCRSISQAIANAPAGASIEVGPGRYGDLDGDGVLGETGEEFAPAGCNCAIWVDKSLTIESRDGPALTVIHGGGVDLLLDVVQIDAADVVFGGVGRKGRGMKGFTLTAGGTGVHVTHGSRVAVLGNVAVGNQDGFRTGSAPHATAFEWNAAVGNIEGWGFAILSDEASMRHNVALRNGRKGGFHAWGDGTIVEENIAIGNGNLGIRIHGSGGRVRGNVAIRNGWCGIDVVSGAGSLEVSGNSAIGNGNGICSESAAAVLRENNLFANRDCGFRNDSGTSVDAPDNFWGDPAGRGGDPADDSCGDPVTTSTIASSEIPVGPATPLSAAGKTRRR